MDFFNILFCIFHNSLTGKSMAVNGNCAYIKEKTKLLDFLFVFCFFLSSAFLCTAIGLQLYVAF